MQFIVKFIIESVKIHLATFLRPSCFLFPLPRSTVYFNLLLSGVDKSASGFIR
jgi:hypothetical protein